MVKLLDIQEQEQTAAGAADPPLTAQKWTRPLRLGVFGCPVKCDNRGVSALGLATLDGLSRTGVPIEVTLFDFAGGARRDRIHVGERVMDVQVVGCHHSRRYYQFSNPTQMLLAARMGLRGVHPMLRRLTELDAILDISGGDSFSDIYGRRRFTTVTLPKRITMELGVPLVLLPQTYGPYRSDHARRTAAEILRAARQVWARDPQSLEVARGLLGEQFDPARHLCGVDVAFGLPVTRPSGVNEADAEQVEQLRASSDLLVGLNVSGLLYRNPADATRQFGFLDSYREIAADLLGRLLAIPQVRLMLVPHVTSSQSHGIDCDFSASMALIQSLPPQQRKRVHVLSGALDASELKWAIAQCDWFCGTRMHACIAALSQGVPVMAIAYSDKTRGVFETVGVAEAVVDPRTSRRAELVEQVLAGLDDRAASAAALQRRLPELQNELAAQFDQMISALAPRSV